MTEFALEMQRTFAVSRDRVFDAWLDPDLLRRWLFPPETTLTHAEADPRVGGRHLVEMLTDTGERHAFDSTITELVPGERIVMEFTFVGPDAQHDREDTLLTLTFADGDAPGTTDFTLRQERITLGVQFNPDNVHVGWGQALAKLAVAIEGS